MKNIKKSNPLAYKKYLEKYDLDAPQNIKARKEEQKKKRRKWWSENWIALTGVFVSVIALVVALLK